MQTPCPCYGHQTRRHWPTFSGKISSSYSWWVLGKYSCLWDRERGRQLRNLHTSWKCYPLWKPSWWTVSQKAKPHILCHKKKNLIKRGMKYKKENADRSTFPQMERNSSHPWHNCHLQLNREVKKDEHGWEESLQNHFGNFQGTPTFQAAAFLLGRRKENQCNVYGAWQTLG